MESSLLRTHKGLSGTTLKRMACVSMLLDHIGASCILMGMFADGVAAGQVVMSGDIYWLYTSLRSIGRLAFPIYCFLMVEGFQHTHDLKKYAGRMLLFAFVSEVPFDWAFYGRPFYWEHQNVYWTLLFGIGAMACLKKAEQTKPMFLGAVVCTVLAELMNTDYGAIGVLLIVALYLLRQSRKKQCLVGAVMVSFEIPAPLAFVPVWFYNGTRGHCGKMEQWAFYLFYPVHLVVLGIITNLVM